MKTTDQITIELSGFEDGLLHGMLNEALEQIGIAVISMPKEARSELKDILDKYGSVRDKLEALGADKVED